MAEDTGILRSLTQEAKGAASAALGLAGNLLSGSQSISAYSQALETNTKILGTFGKAVNGLVKFAEGSLGEYQQLTQLGATFGAQMADIKIAAAEMGMEVKEMTEFFMKNRDSMRGFGGTVEQGTQTFRNFSKGFLDDSAGFSNRLRMMGYSVGDINESLALFGELQEASTLQNQLANGTANKAAYEMATSMDALAKLTGKQKDEIAAEMRERRRQGNVQAFLMGQSEKGAMAFQKATQEISSTMGPNVAKLFEELAIVGAPVSESSKLLQATLGDAGVELDKLVAQYKQGNRSGDFTAFDAQMSKAQGSVMQRLKDEDFRQIAMLGNINNVTAGVGDLYESTFDFRQATDAAAQGAQDLGSVIESMKATARSQQEAQQNAEGLIKETVAMQEQIRKTVIAVQTEAMKRLEQLGTAAIKDVRGVIASTDIAAGVQDALNKVFTGIEDAQRSAVDPMGIFDAVQQAMIDADEVNLNDESAAQAAQELGAKVDDLNKQQVDGIQKLVDENYRIAELEAQRDEMISQGNFDRAAELSQKMEALKEELKASFIEGQKFTAARIAEFQRATAAGKRYTRGFDTGGVLGSGQVGMVGEYGPEFISGPANIMSRIKSAKALDNLTSRSIENRQQQAMNTTAMSGSELVNAINKQTSEVVSGLEHLSRINSSQLNVQEKTKKRVGNLQGNRLRGVHANS